MAVTLHEISADNFGDAIRLEVAPEQSKYVATNAASIAQSKFQPFLECYAICDDDTMVGFCAFGKNPEDGSAWIARFMVGQQHQRQGFGQEGLRVLLDHMREAYACPSIFLDTEPENVAGLGLYMGAGFVDTGKIQGHSKILRLDLE